MDYNTAPPHVKDLDQRVSALEALAAKTDPPTPTTEEVDAAIESVEPKPEA
jgi:hypothetical protein